MTKSLGLMLLLQLFCSVRVGKTSKGRRANRVPQVLKDLKASRDRRGRLV